MSAATYDPMHLSVRTSADQKSRTITSTIEEGKTEGGRLNWEDARPRFFSRGGALGI